MKKIFQSSVYLNDSTVLMVVFDFSAMHWTFAYHLSFLTFDGATIYDCTGYDRDLIKDIALIAMNVAPSKGKRPYQGTLPLLSLSNNNQKQSISPH